MSTRSFVLALVAWTAPPAVVLSAASVAWFSWPGFSLPWFVALLVATGFGIGMVNLMLLILKVDAPGSTYCKVPLLHLERSARELVLRDASGQVLGAHSNGTLRVLRTNLQHGRGLVGALALEHAGGTTLLMTHQLAGAWPGLRAGQHSQTAHRIDAPLFDALLELADGVP
ncbi:hypothetical protein JYK02_04960 [Corallococcus macrosporus]|uniref:Uncharacterized protein n=1 Tax=Corallococcus macrosporus TaxID=35 RepID=A0ABS3D7E9_9BACT|nr:hypothetical protein [Corallococcus macrosporus]MBN8226857.1 hypothetical protein [Corallococcus macrosporus]